jgi:NADPH-dependent curcumin reductase
MSDGPSYAKPVGIGDVMEGGTVSDVVTSNVSGFAKGDIVIGRTGWQTHALSDGSGLQKVDPTRAPISTALGVLGMPGMTAFMELLEIGKPAAGETVMVAAASGAVGSIVGQIARMAIIRDLTEVASHPYGDCGVTGRDGRGRKRPPEGGGGQHSARCCCPS